MNVVILSSALFIIGYTINASSIDITRLVWFVTTLAFLLSLGIRFVLKWGSREVFRPLTLFLLSLSALATIQAITSYPFYCTGCPPLDQTPYYPQIVLGIQAGITALIVFLRSEQRNLLPLCCAIQLTSFVYIPAFTTPEVIWPFLAPIILAVILGLSLILDRQTNNFQIIDSKILITLAGFFLIAVAAIIGSFSPGESLPWLVKLLSLVILILVAAASIQSISGWKIVLGVSLVFSLLIPTVLGLANLGTNATAFGWVSAASYRLNLIELGRANLIVRELMVSWPAAIGLAVLSKNKAVRWSLAGLTGLSIVVFLLAQSWGGLIGAGLTVLFGLWMFGKLKLPRPAKVELRPIWKLSLAALAGVAVVAALAGATWIASQMNVGSFNGRLFQFQSAVMQILDHPTLGAGPGVYHLKSPYAQKIGWTIDSAETLDNPLLPVERFQHSATLHFHNLFLEIGAGVGLVGLGVFIAFLCFLVRRGLQARRAADREWRILVDLALVGVVAAIGWGLLDVMEISPPLLSAPVWVYVALILAAPAAVKNGTELTESQPTTRLAGFKQYFLAGCLALLLVASIFIGLGNYHYQRGFAAFVARDWAQAEDQFGQAAGWEPYQAKYHELQAAALINLKRYPEAIQAYESAARFKRSYSPYLNQLGLLYWQQGDPAKAIQALQQAAKADPIQAWRKTIYPSLGLALASQGNQQAALRAFASGLELDPDLANASEWRRYIDQDGTTFTGLDLAYMPHNSPDELNKRLLALLSQAEASPDTFAYPLGPVNSDQTIPIAEVLQVMESDFQAAAGNPRDQMQILAAMIAVEQSTGMPAEAEQDILRFAALFPESNFANLELGRTYSATGNQAEATRYFDRAVQMRPSDPQVWIAIARAAARQNDPDRATQAIQRARSLAPYLVDVYLAENDLHLNGPAGPGAENTANRIALLRGTTADYLAWYRESSPGEKAAVQACRQAFEKALIANLSPLADEIPPTSQCLAETESQLSRLILNRSYINPRLAGLIQGYADWSTVGPEAGKMAIEAVIAQYPQQPYLTNFLGQVYLMEGESQPAEEQFLRTTQLEAGDPFALESLGTIRLDQKDYQAAIPFFQQAVEGYPGSELLWIKLANAQLLANQVEAARSSMRHARAIRSAYADHEVYSFFSQLPGAILNAPDNGYIHLDLFTIQGVNRDTIFMHPNSSAAYDVQLPSAHQGTSQVLASFSIGMSPDSWSQPGDGVEFLVKVKDPSGEQTVFSQYIDPKHNPADQQWRHYSVDLSEYAGQAIQVILETNSGPAGDLQFDWAGWGDPVLVANPTEPVQ